MSPRSSLRAQAQAEDGNNRFVNDWRMDLHKMNKYAIISIGEDGVVELSIGADIPGQASHGAAIPVGTFDTVEEASVYALERGVQPERIS